MVEVDARYVDWITSEGFERAQKQEGGVPEAAKGFPSQRLQLFPYPTALATSPIESIFDAAATRADSSLLAKAIELFETDLRFWLMPPQEIASAMERVKAMRDSPIVLDRAQQQAQIEEIARDAIVEAFSGERAASWRRRLEEMALVLAKLGKKEEGRTLYATALAGFPSARRSSGGRSASSSWKKRRRKRSDSRSRCSSPRISSAPSRRGPKPAHEVRSKADPPGSVLFPSGFRRASMRS